MPYIGFFFYSFLSGLWIYHHSLLMRNELLILLRISYTWEATSATSTILIVSGFWQFLYDVSRCNIFGSILLGIYWVSWMYRLMLYIKFEKFSAIDYSNIPSAFFLSICCSGTPCVHMLVGLMMSLWFLGVC